MEKKKVLVGMSGGVDSSVSAILLKEQGYEVIGATMKLWGEKEDSSIIDAKKICKTLGIPHYILDYKETFKTCVIDYFIDSYFDAKTPNPCVECNRYLKFGLLFEKAKELGCEYISTGHYAKIEYSQTYHQKVIKLSDSVKKDQTYFLYNIKKEVLDHIILPLQNYHEKEEIRKIAKTYGLEIAQKPDSQEVCFIPDNDYKYFLKKNSNKKSTSGNIITSNGEVLGRHQGLINYTIGQRKGLNIAYKYPLYVLKLDQKKNEVIVGKEEELYQSELYATNVNYLVDIGENKCRVKAKVRYRGSLEDATIYKEKEDLIKVVFDKPQRAITKGQSVVFYDDNILLGGGKII